VSRPTRLLSVLLLAACAAGQPAAPAVEGAVTNIVTGAGIPGAKVVLQLGGEVAYNATTDADGRFRIEAVKDGIYSARYSAEHYESVPLDNRPIQVRPGGAPVRIERRMVPLGRISGRVIDTRGDPVAKARLELTTLSAQWTGEADAKGHFDFDSIFGSETSTLAVAAPEDWKAPGKDPDTGQPRGWATTFYPGVAFREQAAPIALPPGGQLLGLEIRLVATPVHAVRGVLLNSDGGPAPKVAVALWEAGPGKDAAYQTESKADGTFEFPAVVDGDWRLSSHFQSAGVELRAEEWIAMKGRDIEGLKARLGPPFTVSGRVILEAPQGVPPPGFLGLLLIKRHAGQVDFNGLSMLDADPDADGRFRFGGVYAGTYEVFPAEPRLPPFYLDSIRLGDAPVREEVEISAASPELTIVWKTNGGTVRGTVEKCGTGRVVLVPANGPRWGGFVGTCDGVTSGPGRFQIAAVRPGEYYALAVPDYEWGPAMHLDDAALQRAGTHVTVRAGEATQLDLPLSTVR
jgi:hypothetical protein